MSRADPHCEQLSGRRSGSCFVAITIYRQEPTKAKQDHALNTPAPEDRSESFHPSERKTLLDYGLVVKQAGHHRPALNVGDDRADSLACFVHFFAL